MGKVPYTPNEDEKQHALGNIYYEIEQFYYCLVLRMSLPPETIQPIKNAYLESMLVHVRVLKDFFEKENRRFNPKTQEEQDDVLSSDFGFKAATIEGLPQDVQTRINKELVHLTYSRSKRVTVEEKNWHFDRLLPLIIRCIEFMKSISDEQLQRMDEYRIRKGIQPIASAWANLQEQVVGWRIAMQKSSSACAS